MYYQEKTYLKNNKHLVLPLKKDVKNSSQIVRACLKMLYHHEWHEKKHLSQYLQVGGIHPYNRNNMYPVQTQWKMDTPYIRNRHTPYKRKEIPPTIARENLDRWSFIRSRKSLYIS